MVVLRCWSSLSLENRWTLTWFLFRPQSKAKLTALNRTFGFVHHVRLQSPSIHPWQQHLEYSIPTPCIKTNFGRCTFTPPTNWLQQLGFHSVCDDVIDTRILNPTEIYRTNFNQNWIKFELHLFRLSSRPLHLLFLEIHRFVCFFFSSKWGGWGGLWDGRLF